MALYETNVSFGGIPLDAGALIVSPATRAAAASARLASASGERSEYVLVGGGLQNCLIALALLHERPAARLTLIEREQRLGGNHTWCFHAGSAPAAARPWLDRLVVKRWPAHDVCFQGYTRRMHEEYSAITSESLEREVKAAFERAQGARRVTASVIDVQAHRVLLQAGGAAEDAIEGELVIDARGPDRVCAAPKPGYQKFVGLELLVEPGSAPAVPTLMDATVEQLDGFRFMYVLPLSAERVLVEDTYYSDCPELDHELLRERVHAYARERGLRVRGVVRDEHGVLPIPMASFESGAPESPVRAGYAGGLFHPTTGYSLPVALRFALHVASSSAAGALGAEYQRLLADHRRQVRFCLALNRMLFRAFAPEQRHRVLERFYRLPAPTIARFYALETRPADRLRILCGRPPPGFSLSRLLALGVES